jgi:hypothetical protein
MTSWMFSYHLLASLPLATYHQARIYTLRNLPSLCGLASLPLQWVSLEHTQPLLCVFNMVLG